MKTTAKAEYGIHCSPGDWWYPTFFDPKGVERFFPIDKKWFGLGTWTVFNCPAAGGVGFRTDVYRIMDPGDVSRIMDPGLGDDTSPEQFLENFQKIYPTPEDFLKKLNSR